MLYDSYQKKIERIAKIVDTVKKHRVLILSIIGALLAVLVAFLSVKGMITSDFLPRAKQLSYGQTIEENAEALFGTVSYQYRLKGEEEWSEGTPTLVGTYEIRAVSKRTFNIKQYGEVFVIEIIPAKVELFVSGNSFTYGEQPDYTASLIGDDVVSDAEVEMDKLSGTVTARVKADSVKIADKDGNDVTNCYEIICHEKTLTVKPRAVTLKVDSAEKVYDGTPLVSNAYSVDDLVFSDEIEVVFNNSITDCGTVLNTPTFSIKNTAGEDVTENYKVNLQVGNLTVTKRPITLIATSSYNGREYNGEQLLCDGFEIQDGSVVTGHVIKNAKFGAGPINAGEKEVEFKSVQILDGSKDVSSNYDRELLGTTLRVSPRQIRISADKSKIYDGTELAVTSDDVIKVSYGNLLSGHVLTVYTERANAGIYGENNVLWKVNGGGSEQTSNYSVNLNSICLTIDKKDLTLTAGSYEKVYDGRTYTEENHTAIGLVVGDRVDATVSGSITDVGEVESTVTLKEIYSGTNKVTDSYTITYEKGLLKVTPRTVRITPSAQKTYDDTAETDSVKYALKVEKKTDNGTWEEGLYGTQKLKADCSVASGKVDAKDYFGAVSVDKTTIVIENGKVANYSIQTVSGKYTINQRNLTVTTLSGSKEYNGDIQHLDFNEVNYREYCNGLIEGHEITFKSWAGLTEYTGESEDNTVTVSDITCQGVSKFSNYKVSVNPGKFSISKRKISLIFEEEETYAHKKFTYYSGFTFANGRGLVNGHQLKIETKDVVVKTYAGDSGITWTVTKNANDYSHNYDINIENVSIKVKKKKVTVSIVDWTDHEYSADYPSREGYHDDLDCWYTVDGLLSGHRMYLVVLGKRQDVGECNLDVITCQISNGLEGKEQEIYTDNYQGFNDDTFKIDIYQKEVKVQVNYKKYYDGTSYFDDSMKTVVDENGQELIVLNGKHRLSVAATVQESKPKDAGTYEGAVTNYVYDVTTFAGEDVDISNYKFIPIDGDVVIDKRSVTIASEGKNFIVTGEKQSHEKISVTAGTLAEGHKLVIDTNGEIPYVLGAGSDCKNELPYLILDGDDNDCTANYDVVERWGMLTIAKTSISIVFVNLTTLYNGAEHAVSKFAVKGLLPGHDIKFRNYIVLDEYNMAVDKIIDAGNYRVGANAEDAYVILKENGQEEELTKYYNLTSVDFGDYKIAKKEITVSTKNVTIARPTTAQELASAKATIQNSFNAIADVCKVDKNYQITMYTELTELYSGYKRVNAIQQIVIGGETIYPPPTGGTVESQNYIITFNFGELTLT